MKSKQLLLGRLVMTACVAAVLLLAGAAIPGAGAPGQSAKSVVLEYKMPAGRILKYASKEDMTQVSETMGQKIETLVVSTSVCSFAPKGLKGKDHLLAVTIDDKAISITGMQGDLSPDLSSVKGKSFDMVLSPLGAEVDVSGAEAISYVSTAGPRNVATDFKVFFPDLPGKPVKIGDSWPSGYAVDEKAGSVDMRLEFRLVNTLEGFETVDGMECARVVSKVTGSISGSGSQQGMDMLFGGAITGTDVWHFAPKEGVLVKSTSDVVTDMTITVSGAQAMTIPTKQTRKSEIKLSGR